MGVGSDQRMLETFRSFSESVTRKLRKEQQCNRDFELPPYFFVTHAL